MKKLSWLIPFAMLLTLGFASSLARAGETITLCYDEADNFPWLIKGGSGLNNSLIALAASKSGVTTTQQAFPWKRCLHNIATGAVAGGFAASYNEERAAFAVYPTTPDGKLDPSRRMKTDGYSLYRLKGSSVNWDGKQFINLNGRVGVQLGYSAAAELRQYGAQVIESSDGPDAAMQLLMAGKLQMIALMTFEGDEALTDPGVASKVEKMPSPFVEKPFYVIFNKDFYQANKKLVEDFWSGLASARESAEFKKQLAARTKLIPIVPPSK